jgi:hypothetical protein
MGTWMVPLFFPLLLFYLRRAFEAEEIFDKEDLLSPKFRAGITLFPFF